MQSEFEMSMMGELKFFLRFKVKQDKEDIYIHQQKYTKELLKKFKMEDAKPMKTPMHLSGANLYKDESGKPVNHTVLGFCPFWFALCSVVILISCHVKLSERLINLDTTPQAAVI